MSLSADELEYLRKLARCRSPVKRKELISRGGKKLQYLLRVLAYNLLRQNVPLLSREFKSLKKYKKHVRQLADKKTTLKQRFRLEQTGGFLPALIFPVLKAIAGSVIGGAVGHALKHVVKKR
jgi:hypothetical protein